MTIKIVTDSTADLPPEVARELDITVVPLKVRFGNDEYLDGIEISADEFYRRLTSDPVLPSTSQPSSGEFADVYQEIGSNCDGIISIHISADLSGTYNSAIQAQSQASVNCPIMVVDSRTTSMGMGFMAILAAKTAAEGATLDQVVEVVTNAIGRCQCFLMVDTLEYLEKGGRIGKARATVGNLLKIKPLLIVQDGEVHELSKERTHKKGLTKLQQVARNFAPLDNISILYSTNLQEAEMVAENLADLTPGDLKPSISRFGPVLGTYVGPDSIGIGLLQSDADFS